MTRFDYDVVIIGSGFGGSVAALRAAEKGYRVGVMESGRRWKDEDIPKTQWNLYLAETLGVEIHELHEVHAPRTAERPHSNPSLTARRGARNEGASQTKLW